MEATVRYIHTNKSVLNGQELLSGNKPALCFRGKEYALGIINDESGIIPVRLTLRDHDKSPLVRYGDEEYPVGRFIQHMERIMADKSVDPEALRLMLEWPNNPEDFGMPTIKDEEPPPPKKKTSTQPKSNLISSIANELKLTPQKVRKFLRSQGLMAPYENEGAIRQALQNYK